MSINQDLRELLYNCTVQLEIGRQRGSGFFVAPGTILTCAHVVKSAAGGGLVHVIYGEQAFDSQPLLDSEIFLDNFPDLALLHLEFTEHPCVLLGGNVEARDEIYSYGYSINHPEGESTTVECEGEIGRFIKLKEGQVKPGSSGSPLLNEDTGHVCGVMKLTRDSTIALGGGGVPVATVFEYFPDLERQNHAFHRRDSQWKSLLEKRREARASNIATALVYKTSGKISLPQYWVGREDLLVHIKESLDQSRRILLTGMGGIGKTALAQVLVDRWLQTGGTPVIWIEVRDEKLDVLIEALAECCGDNNISSIPNIEGKKKALRELFENYETGLLVLDNVHNIDAAVDVLEAVPDKLQVLITSRWRFAVDVMMDISQLKPTQGLDLLGKACGGKDFSTNEDAIYLCELFGYHPLALEIAGANMRERGNTNPKALRKRLEADPLKLSSLRHGEIRPLLDDSIEDLSEILKNVFFAFGKFPANGLTSSLLALYLEKPESDVLDALDALVIRNLVKYREETEFYFMHDLIFTYVQTVSRPNESEKPYLIKIGIDYLQNHSRDYDLVGLDLPNLLGIARLAEGLDLVKLLSFLSIGNFPLLEGKSYADQRGYSLGVIVQLDRAIETARNLGEELKPTTHYLLGKRGNAAFQRGEYQLAAEKYEDGLRLSPDDKRRAIVGSILARTFVFCERTDESQKQFEYAHQIAENLEDDDTLNFVLEQESWAAGYLQDYETAQKVAEKQLILAEKLYAHDEKDYESLGYALILFGSAKLYLAKKSREKLTGF